MILKHNLESNDRADAEVRCDSAHQRTQEVEENKHRRELEKKDQTSEDRDRKEGREIERRGQIFAAAVAFGGFVVCAIALVREQTTAAIWLGCTMIVSLVGAFLVGKTLSTKAATPSPATSETESAEQSDGG